VFEDNCCFISYVVDKINIFFKLSDEVLVLLSVSSEVQIVCLMVQLMPLQLVWRRGVVVSGVRRMNAS